MNLLRMGRGRAVAIVGLSAVVLVAGIAGALLLIFDGGGKTRTSGQGGAGFGLVLEPTKTGPEGIAEDTRFVLTSKAEISADLVRSALQVTPGVELEVSEKGLRSFEIVPREVLQQGVVYRFRFGEEGAELQRSWAFQVRSPLRVVSTLPAKGVDGVPIDAGIEVTFSHDGVQDAAGLTEITPDLNGHWEQHGRTQVFVAGELARDTLYTVRIKAGMGVPNTELKLAEDYAFQFETGESRRGQDTAPQTFDFLHKIGEWGTKDAPVVSIYTNDTGLKELPFEVFAYASIDAFTKDLQEREDVPYWAQFTRDRKTVDTAGLAPVLSFSAGIEGTPRQAQNYFGAQTKLYVRFPQSLAPGYYLVQTRFKNTPVQAWLQVTDVATYLAVSQTKTLVWVNDVSTGDPLEGAKVRLNGTTDAGTTDAQGIVRFDTTKEMVESSGDRYNTRLQIGRGFLTVTDRSGRVAVVPVSPVMSTSTPGGRDGSFIDRSYASAGYDYWDYAVTDRPIYQPDDTVRFWGVALPREGGASPQLTAQMMRYANDGRGLLNYPEKVTIQPSDFGTFTGEFPLKGMDEGYHTISINGPDGFITGISFQVARYVKPAYKIDVTPSKTAVFEGETIDVDVAATFFDGTPLPGLRLRYQGKGAPAELTTDAQGKARFQLTPVVQDPSYVTGSPITLAPASFEEGEISGQAMVYVFPAAAQISAGSSFEDGQVTLAGRAYTVDPSRFVPGPDIYAFTSGYGKTPDYVTGRLAGRTITAQVTEQVLVATEVGETYDFINKVSRKVYRYETRSGVTFSLTAVTDQDGAFDLSFPSAELRNYQIKLSVDDGSGRTAVLNTYAQASTPGFDVGGVAYILTDRAPENSLFFSTDSLEIGDKTTLVFHRGSDVLPGGGKNRYLFYEGQRGIRHYEVVDQPRYDLTFSDRQVPSAVIGGVYFNGFTYIEAQYGPTLVFNPASRKLNIEIRSLQDSYKPGDEAKVEVSVTDAGGKPVQAEVNLSAVDEAVFAVSDFYAYQQDILRQLYQQVPSGIIRTYASHQYPPSLLEFGGRGGGGGARTDFLDVALFKTVRTDAAGKAEVSFKLPDNLTSWRVTAYGFSKDLKAGQGVGSVVVSLPFSVDVSLNADYVAGDSPQVRLRAVGEGLKAGDAVDFMVSSPSLASGQPVSASAKAFEDALVPLGELAPGPYEITVAAKSGGLEDKVVRKFTVLDSRAQVAALQLYEDVGAGTKFDPGSGGRATVTFIDAGRGEYYRLLSQLRWAYGDRLDQALARTMAAEMLRDWFGETDQPADFRPTPYLKVFSSQPGQSSRREPGVAILPYSDPDIALTARVANLAPGLFGRETLRQALETVADTRDETPERQAIALYGLAGLGEPVLVRLQTLDADPDIGWRGHLYVALGLQALGDDEGASAILNKLLSENGEKADPWLRLRIAEDDEDSIEATALAAVVAAGTGDDRASRLLRYVRENCSSEHLLYLDELQYLALALPRAAAAKADFDYSAGGQAQRVTLEKGQVRSVSLSADEVKVLKVDVRDGRVAATVRYSMPLSSGAQTSPDLKVSRTVKVGGQPTTEIPATTGLIEVTLTLTFGPQAPDGCYQVSDALPSGLKAVTQPAYLTAQGPAPFLKPGFVFPYLLSGQRISFCGSRQQTTMTYYARPSGRGEFTWEPAVVQNMRAPGIMAFSDALKVTVK